MDARYYNGGPDDDPWNVPRKAREPEPERELPRICDHCGGLREQQNIASFEGVFCSWACYERARDRSNGKGKAG